MKRKVRWVLNDEADFADYKTKKAALKEYRRLKSIDYKYMCSIRLLRHNIINDTYIEIDL